MARSAEARAAMVAGADLRLAEAGVEHAGMSTLYEGQRVSHDVVTERGKQAASNLQNA